MNEPIELDPKDKDGQYFLYCRDECVGFRVNQEQLDALYVLLGEYVTEQDGEREQPKETP